MASCRMRISAACRDRVLRVDRPVGRHVEAELVVVGPLPDAGGLDVVRDPAHRGEDRVDRDHADRVLRPAVVLRRDVATAAADRQRDLEAAAVGEVRDLEIRVQDLQLRGCLEVARLDDAGALLREAHLDLGRVAVQDRDEVLEVEDDVGDVLTDARQRRELVLHALELHRGDRGALERREQDAAQRVAERVAEAAVERLDLEDATVLVDLLVDDLRNLKFHQAGADCQSGFPSFVTTWSKARR